MAKVRLTPEAVQQLEALNKQIHRRVLKLLERLGHWPEVSGAKSLSSNLAGSYRMRTGDYRVQFHVEGQTVTVEKIGHRARFYE